MTISRYKIMAGILGVSIGGLAAVAGQCPRPDTPHRSGDAPPADAKMPSAGSKPSALPAVPPPADLLPPSPTSPVAVDLPSLPSLPVPTLPGVPTTAPAKLPDLPPVTPVKAEMPKPASLPTPVVIPAAGSALPDVPPALPSLPSAPEKAPATPTAPKAAAPMTAPASPKAIEPSAPPAAVVDPLVVSPAPVVLTPQTPTNSVAPTPAVEAAPARALTPAPQQAAATATRFRILLRVGEGEPMFEVKNGDDLVLRVVCEKVDIKSPEKGQGPSAVTATGKVRFVGFGAEGTCDSLSFMAGTGDVTMTGAVRVQVKDRIGRVESELTSERLQYRLDANALPGTLRP